MKATALATDLLVLLVLLGSVSLCWPASAGCIDYGDYLHLLGGVDAPGSAYRLAVAGSYAYLACAPDGFTIVDVSDPQDPHVMSSSDIPCGDVAVSGRYAYVAAYYDPRLDVVDVSDPTLPIVVGQVALPADGNGVTVSGSYVYVAAGVGLEVIDVTDPLNPHIVGNAYMHGVACRVAVSGAYAYVATREGLRVVDVSDPHDPFVVGIFRTLSVPTDIAVQAEHAYVAVDSGDENVFWGLEVIDVADPSRPRSLGKAATPGGAQGVAVSSTTAYVACGPAGLQAIDVADPLNPRILGEVPGTAWHVALSGKLACVGTGGRWTVALVDITRAKSAPLVGSVHLPDEAHGLAIRGSHAYIGARVSGLQVVDFSDPASPRIVASADLFWAIGVAVSGPYAYVTAGYGPRELVVVDISDPLNPYAIGSAVTLGSSTGVAISGNYAYVADSEAGMTVVDISNPHAPVVVANLSTPGWARVIAVSGTYAYVGDSYGLRVMDIKDPLHPRIVGNTGTGIRSIAVLGTYAYAGTADGLQILDVASPETPVIVSTLCTPAWAVGVAIRDGYAYVGSSTNYGSDVLSIVVDISDPYDPRIVGSFAVSGSVGVADEYVCVASVESGFHVARLQCGSSAAARMVDPRSTLPLQVIPNPALVEITLRLSLSAPERVHASVVDVGGRQVRNLLDGILGPGVREIAWDARDEHRRRVAPGVYVVHVSAGTRASTARAVILR
ncbi:MAG: hypothetical protein ACE15D_15350 [Candidatus Eisenbacteria bacterium]